MNGEAALRTAGEAAPPRPWPRERPAHQLHSPDLFAAAKQLLYGLVLDGELLVWSGGQCSCRWRAVALS
ncbi:hypothetical protein GCM10009730_51440 [Streptomyces albidochromogenes]